MFISIYVCSKNKLSIINYLKFIKKRLKKRKLKTKIITYVFKKKIKTTVFTVLKSPHVNKTAQTQFENKLYKTQLTIYSNNYYKLIYFIKYFSENNFSDIKIKIKFIKNKSMTSILNMSNYFLKSNVNTTAFFKILDTLGELQFKNVV